MSPWQRIWGYSSFKKDVHSIVVIKYLYGLTRKSKGQLSVIDIDNDTTSYVVQRFLINYISFAQAHNAGVTRPFYFLKRVGYVRLHAGSRYVFPNFKANHKSICVCM